MKIVVATNFFPVREQPYRGHSAYQTIREMNKQAEVKVFGAFAAYPSILSPRNRPWLRTDLTFAPPDVDVTYLNYPALPGITRAINGWTCARTLEDKIRRERPDVLLSYWLYPDCFSAAWIGRRLGIPVVSNAVGSDVNCVRGVSKRLTKMAMRMSDRVVTVSSALRDRAIEMGIEPAKVVAITSGCDGSLFRLREKSEARAGLGIAPRRKLYLYAGRLDRLKGLRELILAAAAIRESVDADLVLLGDGPDREELVREVREQKLTERVRFVPAAPTQLVAQWMSACDVFCLPSYNEGYPNVVLEALSSGRPVVASSVGGIPEQVEEGFSGFLVEPRNADQLSRAMAKALNTSWDHDAIASRSRRSWADVASDLLQLCRALLDPATK